MRPRSTRARQFAGLKGYATNPDLSDPGHCHTQRPPVTLRHSEHGLETRPPDASAGPKPSPPTETAKPGPTNDPETPDHLQSRIWV